MPRQPVARAISYDTNHQARMNDPECRRLGLSITSSLMESTIQFRRRVKGTEEFSGPPTPEGSDMARFTI